MDNSQPIVPIDGAAHSLDHIAIRVVDREAAAQELLAHFDMRVIEQTDRFTLIGADFEHGKITLLDAESDEIPVPRRIVSIVLAERAGATLSPPVQLSSGVVVTFANADQLGSEWKQVPRHALVGVTLRADDPTVSAARLATEHGMKVTSARPDVAILDVGGPGAGKGRITLMRERWDGVDGPTVLDHIGIRVRSAAAWRAHALSLDAHVVRWVDAAHSKAVFVDGPDDLLIEFVEHTAAIGV